MATKRPTTMTTDSDTTEPETIGTPVLDEPASPSLAPTLPAPPEADDAPPVTEHPSTEPEITVERAFAHRKEATVAAFVHCEKLKGVTRKLTAAGWKAELAAFMLVER
jgi:hypothetical protein